MGSLTIIIILIIITLILTLTSHPVHQQETSLFFLFPSSIPLLPLLYFTFFHLGELGQPNHVQFRVTVNCDDGHILLFLHLPSRCPGQRQNKKASRAEKKKVKFSSNFPFVIIHHILYTRVGMSTERKNNCGRDNRSFLGGDGRIGSFYFLFFLVVTVYPVFGIFIDKKGETEEGRGLV